MELLPCPVWLLVTRPRRRRSVWIITRRRRRSCESRVSRCLVRAGLRIAPLRDTTRRLRATSSAHIRRTARGRAPWYDSSRRRCSPLPRQRHDTTAERSLPEAMARDRHRVGPRTPSCVKRVLVRTDIPDRVRRYAIGQITDPLVVVQR